MGVGDAARCRTGAAAAWVEPDQGVIGLYHFKPAGCVVLAQLRPDLFDSVPRLVERTQQIQQIGGIRVDQPTGLIMLDTVGKGAKPGCNRGDVAGPEFAQGVAERLRDHG